MGTLSFYFLLRIGSAHIYLSIHLTPAHTYNAGIEFRIGEGIDRSMHLCSWMPFHFHKVAKSGFLL